LNKRGVIKMKKISQKLMGCFLTLVLIISITALPSITSEAKTTTYYGDYGSVGGIMCHSTRVKYTYDTKSVTTTIKKGTPKKIGKIENKSKKKKNCSSSYSVSYSKTVSISASIPLDIIKKIVKINGNVTPSRSYTKSEGCTMTISEVLPKKSSVNVYLRYDKEIITYKLTCQKQVQNTFGVWKNSGKKYTKTITEVNEYPVLYTKSK